MSTGTKRLFPSAVAALVVAGLIGGCSLTNPKGTNEKQGTPAPEKAKVTERKLKVGMVTDLGSVNDKSFNQNAWEGLQQLRDRNGYTVKYLEPKSDADVIPNLNQFVKAKYDLTWGTGFTLDKAVTQVAKENPKAKLAIVDAFIDLPNVASVTFKENEGSYLVGVVAGKMTKTNKVGFVGGMKIPVIKKFEAGFREGVKAVNPKAQLIVNYTGEFTRVDMGKSAASTIYNDGADIIFHASGLTGNGVFNEAKERRKQGEKVWVIGVDKDQSLTFGDDITLTSMIKRVDTGVITVSRMLGQGKFPGGKATELGLKENGVGIAATSKKNVPADVLKLVDDYRKQIVAGKVKVPIE